MSDINSIRARFSSLPTEENEIREKIVSTGERIAGSGWLWSAAEIKNWTDGWEVIWYGDDMLVTDLRAKTGRFPGMTLREMAATQRGYLRLLYTTSKIASCEPIKACIRAWLGEDDAVIKEKAE